MKNIKEILDKFILQSGFDERQYGPGGQIVKEYPKEFLDLKMKVSFGIGTPARVPWISYLAPGMNTSDGFYPVYLFYKKENVWASNDDLLIFDSSILHSAENSVSGSFRLIYNFSSPEQLNSFSSRKQINELYSSQLRNI